MREDSPSDAEPETLLALVGTSPLPPLHAALEFKPGRLVLAHSSDTRWRAEGVKAAAKKHGGITDVGLVDLGTRVFDFRAVRCGLAPFLAEMQDRPWRLCFTGGTKVMAVEAALAHCAAFPGRHHWRSYLDVSTDTVWFTDGSHRDAAAGSGLELEDLAELHGVRIEYDEDKPSASEAAQQHLDTRGRTSGIWVDKVVLLNAPHDLRRLSVAQRPTVVVTAGDRALGLAAPRQRGDKGAHRTAWAHAAFAATKVLQKLCGPAGRTLALLRTDAGDPKRAKELHRWMAWHSGSDPEQLSKEEHAKELTAHEEMYRPALCPANPDDSGLAVAVAEALDALLPR